MFLTTTWTLGLALTPTAKYIVPGGRWLDTEGNFVDAHAGGITVDQESGKFYRFGEYKTEEEPEGRGFGLQLRRLGDQGV